MLRLSQKGPATTPNPPLKAPTLHTAHKSALSLARAMVVAYIVLQATFLFPSFTPGTAKALKYLTEDCRWSPNCLRV